jgi:hypothetical protein
MQTLGNVHFPILLDISDISALAPLPLLLFYKQEMLPSLIGGAQPPSRNDVIKSYVKEQDSPNVNAFLWYLGEAQFEPRPRHRFYIVSFNLFMNRQLIGIVTS